MSTNFITITKDRKPAIESWVRRLPAIIAGHAADPGGIGQGIRDRMGFALAAEVEENFDNLSEGKAGVDGDIWPPNTPEYLAYGKGPKSSRKGTGRVNRWPDKPGSGMLSVAERKAWGRIYARNLGFLAGRHQIGKAKQIAAALAWNTMKEGGAKTLIETFGKREDTILVDTGILRRSLQPGELVEGEFTATYVTKTQDQIYHSEPGRIVYGTRNPTASFHHNGQGNRRRRLWPDVFPDSWWQAMLFAAGTGLGKIGPLITRGLI